MIFQDPYSSLNPRMTVGEIIGEGCGSTAIDSSAQVREQVGDWLERVGLEPDHASRYPHEFSGGQRQRVGIARALIMKPKFVVCDEPISALDVSVQAQVVRLLGELKASLGLTMLFIAHDLSMVRYISDRMAVMYLGSLVEIGPAKMCTSRPLHPYTQTLVASNPSPTPRSERERATIPITGEIASPVNIGLGCRFAGRCPMVMDVCRTVTPELRGMDDRDVRLVACHLFRALHRCKRSIDAARPRGQHAGVSGLDPADVLIDPGGEAERAEIRQVLLGRDQLGPLVQRQRMHLLPDQGVDLVGELDGLRRSSSWTPGRTARSISSDPTRAKFCWMSCSPFAFGWAWRRSISTS